MRQIRNYTSNQDVDRSVAMIEDRLRSFGATGIYKEYDQKQEIKAISFMLIEPKTGTKLAIRLPSEVGKVTGKLLDMKKKKPISQDQKQRIGLQARRTAWKLILDWLDVQLSMVYLDQAEPAQIFLPYLLSNGKTVYERVVEAGFKALEDGLGHSVKLIGSNADNGKGEA